MIISLYITTGIVITIAGAIWYAIYHVLPYSAIKPYRVTQEKLNWKFPPYNSDSIRAVAPHHFTFTTRDSVVLDAWFVRSALAQPPKGTVIILHGIASCKEMMLGAILQFTKLGYNVVAYDSRANGISGGEYCTLGYYEKYDVGDCITALEKEFKVTGSFAVYGASMGGAIAMQALAVEPRISCGIVMSTFATLRETTYDYMEQIIGIRWQWIGKPVMEKSEQIARFSIDDVAPEKYAKRVRQPVLVVHGDADEKISVQYGRRLYNALASEDKQLEVVRGAGHFNLDAVGGERLQQKVAQWMDSHMDTAR